MLSLCSLYSVRMGAVGVAAVGEWDLGPDCKRRRMGLWSEKASSGSSRTVQERTMWACVRVRIA